jgi:Enoyl-(Acyl carrier protein) reductase
MSALENKIGVVSAIGSAIMAGLEQEGACAVSLDVARPAAGAGPFQACDVRDDASVASAIAEVQQIYGRVDLVVHAAGVSREAVLWKLAVEDWDFVQSVNLRGAFLLLRHAIPVMRAGEGGRIVLIGSINGSRGKFGTSAYSASKAGLIALARTVAREAWGFSSTSSSRDGCAHRSPIACRRRSATLIWRKVWWEGTLNLGTWPTPSSFFADPECSRSPGRSCASMADSRSAVFERRPYEYQTSGRTGSPGNR